MQDRDEQEDRCGGQDERPGVHVGLALKNSSRDLWRWSMVARPVATRT
jgi:hypothetical protein